MRTTTNQPFHSPRQAADEPDKPLTRALNEVEK